MKKIEILDFNSFAYMREGENVNMIFTSPLLFFCPSVSNASLVVKHQLVELEEAPNTTELDSKENVTIMEGDTEKSRVTYIINQDNQLVFLVDKNIVLNDCMAREFIVGFIVSYETSKVIYTTTGNVPTYDLIVRRGKDGAFVTAYKQSSLPSLVQILPGLDNTLDVDATGGYVYEIFRDLTACKK